MFDFTILGVGHLAVGLVLTLDVLLTKHRPVSAVLWLAVVWAFPYGGALAYLSIGVDRVRRGAAAREASKALVAQRADWHPTFERLAVDYERPGPGEAHRFPAQHIFRSTDRAVRQNRVFQGNRVELLVDGDEFYPALFDAISAAESSIHLQTFVFGRDRAGQDLLDRLIARARDGIECRLLYDRFGSTRAYLSRFFGKAKDSGVQVRSITQANPLKGRFQINLRNHRKIAVIDGSIGFVGGINIHDKNLSERAVGRPIRDYHVKLQGPAVSDLQFQFVEDWYFASQSSKPRAMHGSKSFREAPN
jgi:cardiolipin synthase